jgi:hypothetical protein
MNRKPFYILAIVVLLLATFTAGQIQPARNADAQIGSGIGNFDINGPVRINGSVTILDDLSVADQFSAADFAASDDLSITDDTTVGGDLWVGAWIAVTPVATATVTSGGTLAPAGSLQPISSSGTVGFGAISGCTGDGSNSGRQLTVYNGANQTITITETGNLVQAGNAALGQHDNISYVCRGTQWVETARVNN